jgi:hypothetical protein
VRTQESARAQHSSSQSDRPRPRQTNAGNYMFQKALVLTWTTFPRRTSGRATPHLVCFHGAKRWSWRGFVALRPAGEVRSYAAVGWHRSGASRLRIAAAEPGKVSCGGAGIAGGGRGPREDAGGEAAGTS